MLRSLTIWVSSLRYSSCRGERKEGGEKWETGEEEKRDDKLCVSRTLPGTAARTSVNQGLWGVNKSDGKNIEVGSGEGEDEGAWANFSASLLRAPASSADHPQYLQQPTHLFNGLQRRLAARRFDLDLDSGERAGGFSSSERGVGQWRSEYSE